jgi:putative acetyltransferase
VSQPSFNLRPYTEADEAAAIALWQRTWQQHYPQIDFAKRVEWWRSRWRNELVPTSTISVAVSDDQMVGFVTVNPQTGYLDQIVVAPEAWGSEVASMLMVAARRVSPQLLELQVNADNGRAIRFYQKQGFVDVGEAVNEISGALLRIMRWRP